MKPRHRRMALIIAGVTGLAVAAWLVLSAFQQNLVFFFTPSQVAANEAPQGRAFRVGGMVEVGSVKRQPDGVTVHFTVTDTAKSMPVAYKGVLPDLFREGKGVVTQPTASSHATDTKANRRNAFVCILFPREVLDGKYGTYRTDGTYGAPKGANTGQAPARAGA